MTYQDIRPKIVFVVLLLIRGRDMKSNVYGHKCIVEGVARAIRWAWLWMFSSSNLHPLTEFRCPKSRWWWVAWRGMSWWRRMNQTSPADVLHIVDDGPDVLRTCVGIVNAVVSVHRMRCGSMCLESCFLDRCCWRRSRNGYRTCHRLGLSYCYLLCCCSCRPRTRSLNQRCRVYCRWKD